MPVRYHEKVDEYLCYDCFPKRVWERFGSSNTQNTGTKSAEGRSTERYKERSIERTESKVLREITTLSHSSRLKEVDIACLSLDRAQRTCSTGRWLSEPALDAIKDLLSISYEFAEPFRCVIPKTSPHDATLTIDADGREVYQCDVCKPECPLTLAEICAALKYDELAPRSSVQCSRWHERLLYDAGLKRPTRVSFSVPEAATKNTRTLASHIKLFLGLRDRQWDGQPITLARPFWSAYTGLSDRKIRAALDALKDASLLQAVVRPPKGSRDAIQWILPGVVIHTDPPWRFPE
jgi:hypothetical protein